MLALVAVESRGDPYKIGVNSGAALIRQPRAPAEAIAAARALIAKGANFDAGLAQVNSANFARLGLTPETVFDPCTNLTAAASVLKDNYTRAQSSGAANPLHAALSEYNTGSRERGLRNGYVGRIYAAAGNMAVPAIARSAITRPAVLAGNPRTAPTPQSVARLILRRFGGRITDTVRPWNASYGAANSYHKYAQAVDFVPAGGVGAITRAQVRETMASAGLHILELLGPGDPGHSNHWHVAFALGGSSPPYLPGMPPEMNEGLDEEKDRTAPSMLVASSDGDSSILAPPVNSAETKSPAPPSRPAPPAWDVFARQAWVERSAGARHGSGS